MFVRSLLRCESKLIGVVNLTKHSFSQDGVITKATRTARIARVLAFADGVDLGGESTGPGAPIVKAESEKRAIRSALQIVKANDVRTGGADTIISIDTRRPEIALLALSDGANMINDVSGGRGVALSTRGRRKVVTKTQDSTVEDMDPSRSMLSLNSGSSLASTTTNISLNMFEVVRQFPHASLVLMYSPRLHGLCSDPMCEEPTTENILRFFERQLNTALQYGMSVQRQIILDPGMGRFLSQDAQISHRVFQEIIPTLKEHFPEQKLFVGASRKSFLDILTHRPTIAQDRVGSSLAALAVCQDLGVDYVRVHDVEWASDFMKVRKILSEKGVTNTHTSQQDGGSGTAVASPV